MKIEIVENNVYLIKHSNENFEIHPLWLRERAKTESLVDKYKDQVYSRKVSTIKSLFRYLTQNSLIDYNISKLIPSPKVAKKIPHYLSKNKIEEGSIETDSIE